MQNFNFKLYGFFVFILLVNGSGAIAQTDTLQQNVVKTQSLSHFFASGSFSGHLRSYSMMTINENTYPDYFTTVYGLGLAYKTPVYKGIFAGISGRVVSNIYISSLYDTIDKSSSCYESALFDIADPARRNALMRIENMFLGYTIKKVKIVAGKQEINTPLINKQDSRIFPTLASGIWIQVKPTKYLELQNGWIDRFSPRSTTNWYRVQESIMYAGGVDTDGNKAAYIGNLRSAGLLISGATYKKNNLQIQAWNYLAENIFNTVYNQADVSLPVHHKRMHILLGAEMLLQTKLGNGGNANPEKAYIQTPENAFVFGSMAGIKKGTSTLSINYLRITSHNRYLKPREWGKEQFYATLPRERVEGSGNISAVNIKLAFKDSTKQLNFEAAYGVYNMPDVKNYKLNKYGLPSYDQLYMSLTKHGNGFLKNTDVRIIYIYKRTLGNTYNDAKYILNKGNMHHADLIFNFNF